MGNILNDAIFKSMFVKEPPKDEDEQAIDALKRLGQPDVEKAAFEAVNAFTRRRVHEDGILRHIMPPLLIPFEEP